jgi:hypothetical protein
MHKDYQLLMPFSCACDTQCLARSRAAAAKYAIPPMTAEQQAVAIELRKQDKLEAAAKKRSQQTEQQPQQAIQ